jgi:hypothetical protein
LGLAETEIFLKLGLDRANHFDRSTEISLRTLARAGLDGRGTAAPILRRKPVRPAVSTLRRIEFFQQPEDASEKR